MQMDKAMDAGDVWLQKSIPIEAVDTAQTLHDRLAEIGGEIILPAINKILEGKEKPKKQSQNMAKYCTKLHKSDGLIDWNEEICKFIAKFEHFSLGQALIRCLRVVEFQLLRRV